VLDAHPAAGIGVDVFFVTVFFVYLRIPVCDVFLKLGCYRGFMIVQCRVCPALMVPLASGEPGAVCILSPVKVGGIGQSKRQNT
jgi:hypothetical protein